MLDAAMQHFWRHGYAGSSMRDIEAATGLGAASLYNAFGDKRALFLAALEHYIDRNMRARIARLEAGCAPREAIARFLGEIVERSLADQDQRGCLMVNTALDVAPHDAVVAAAVAAKLAELEAFFARQVAAGQRDGSIAAGDPEDRARLLVATVVGLRVLARVRREPALLEGAARQALALLDPPMQQEPAP